MSSRLPIDWRNISISLIDHASVLLLKHNKWGRWFSALPLRGKIAVFTGELVKKRFSLICQTRLYFPFPEIKTFTRGNPSRGHAHIDNDELNRSRSEELSDTFFRE